MEDILEHQLLESQKNQCAASKRSVEKRLLLARRPYLFDFALVGSAHDFGRQDRAKVQVSSKHLAAEGTPQDGSLVQET